MHFGLRFQEGIHPDIIRFLMDISSISICENAESLVLLFYGGDSGIFFAFLPIKRDCNYKNQGEENESNHV